MKIVKWAGWLLLGAVPFLSGCDGFWNAPASSSSTTLTTTTLSSGVFYVLNIETSQIVAYYVDAGKLTQIATYSTPATPITLTVAPSNIFLYLSTVNGIYLYTISSSGTLTLGNSSSARWVFTVLRRPLQKRWPVQPCVFTTEHGSPLRQRPTYEPKA